MNTTFSLTDSLALSPLLILLSGALLILLLESFVTHFSKKYVSSVALITIATALYANFYTSPSTNPLVTPWIRFDALAYFFNTFFLIIGIAATLLAAAFFHRFKASRGEYYFFLLCALFGLLLIGSSADFLTLFMGLEMLSISLYLLCGYMKEWKISQEAAIKYFLMGSLGAAFLLYGIALIYGSIGTTQFDSLLSGYQQLHTLPTQALFMGGIALITIGLAFKATVVPFHIWAPDVYEGAPTPVTAFMAVGTKVGAFAAFIIVFLLSLPNFNPVWNEALSLFAFATLLYANFVALRQNHLRRFFAYSGMSHAGFLLLPLVAEMPDSLSAILFYLVVYAFATFGCFAVLAFIDHRTEGALFNDLKGLLHRSPLLAGILALCLLTLAGIPPTAGFFAKFYLFKVAFEGGYYLLTGVALLTTILSAYYYLRIIGVMLTDALAEDKAFHYSLPAAIVGGVAIVSILLLSLYPEPLLSMIINN